MNQVASSVRERAVQASKPWPVKVVSDSVRSLEVVAAVVVDEVLAGWSWPTSRRAHAASVAESGATTSAGRVLVRDGSRRSSARARLVAGGTTTTATGESSEVTTRSGRVTPWVACGRQVHGRHPADEIGRAGHPARVADVDRLPVEAHAAGPAGHPRTGQSAGTATLAPRKETVWVSPVSR